MLLSSWNRKYPPFLLLSYFSVVVCLRCLLHHILLLIAYICRENREFVFIIIVRFVMSANYRMLFFLKIVFVCLYITPSHYHHCANLSEDIELIKCLSDIFCRACEWDKAYSLSYPLYNTYGCVFSVTHFLVIIERIYILCLIIIIKSEVWTITHCLGLGHDTMVCAVCIFAFFLPYLLTYSHTYRQTDGQRETDRVISCCWNKYSELGLLVGYRNEIHDRF